MANNLHELAKLLRYDILTSTTAAGSGHPTSSLSAVEVMTVLFFGGYFCTDFDNPRSITNDRIIFSKGHAAPLLYSLYQAAGVITHEELLTLRKFGSKLEGHPTTAFDQIDVATGSLGQGLSVGIGMALGLKLQLNEQLNMNALPNIYVLLGDSEMAEGQVWEALALANHYNLENLIAIVDVNRLGQRGETMLGWDVETYKKRAEAFGWETCVIENGNNIDDVIKAFQQNLNKENKRKKPLMIIAKTQKGAGVDILANKDNWHGKPLPKEFLQQALHEIGQVNIELKGVVEKPLQQITILDFKRKEFDDEQEYTVGELIATREAYGNSLVQLGYQYNNLVVLDAETSNSTFAEKFKKDFAQKFFEMFIAEQNMTSTAVGFSKVGYIPFISSFAAFLTRAFDQIRMAQYSNANIKIVGSHAGISIGPDGSSQMALEDIAMMKSILHSTVLYPSDATSTKSLVKNMLEHDGIFYLRLTREKTPVIYHPEETFPIGGSKIVRSSEKDSVAIITAGITLHEAIKAHQELQKEDIYTTIIDAYSVKPLDEKTIIEYAKKMKKIIIVEDHYPAGGLGEAVKSALAGIETDIIHLAVKKIPHSGEPAELLRDQQIDAAAIIQAVKQLL